MSAYATDTGIGQGHEDQSLRVKRHGCLTE